MIPGDQIVPHEWHDGIWLCLGCGQYSPDPCTCECHKVNFEGHQPRECGEHRTVGPHRAWCHDCHEWCYPSDGCSGCRLGGMQIGADVVAKMMRLDVRPGEVLAICGEFTMPIADRLKQQVEKLLPDIAVQVFPSGTTFAVLAQVPEDAELSSIKDFQEREANADE